MQVGLLNTLWLQAARSPPFEGVAELQNAFTDPSMLNGIFPLSGILPPLRTGQLTFRLLLAVEKG
jgi:hypothetical protein